MSVLLLKIISAFAAILFLMAMAVAAGVPQGEVNYVGIAAVIGAIATFVAVITTTVMQAVGLMNASADRREARLARAAAAAAAVAASAHLGEVKELVDGVSHKLAEANKRADLAEGEAVGVAKEQARVETPKP